MSGAIRGVGRVTGGVLKGWMEMEVLWDQKGISSIKGHWGLLGSVGDVRGCQRPLGGVRKVQGV